MTKSVENSKKSTSEKSKSSEPSRTTKSTSPKTTKKTSKNLAQASSSPKSTKTTGTVAPKSQTKPTTKPAANQTANKTAKSASSEKPSTQSKTADSKNKKPTKKNRFALVALIIGAVLVIGAGIIGFGGYYGYKNYIKPEILASQINELHNEFNPIEADYESLLTQIDGYDSTQYPEEQSRLIKETISQINTKLDSFDQKLGSRRSDELDAYVTALKAYSENMQKINTNMDTLVGYSACYTTFDTSTQSLGQSFAEVDQNDTDRIAALYEELLTSTGALNTCLTSLGNDNLTPLTSIIGDLESQTKIVISGIKDDTLTQEQLNSFLESSVKLQDEGLKYAQSLTKELENGITEVDQNIAQIREEETYLTETYNVTFEGQE